jgi:hypothetical protein
MHPVLERRAKPRHGAASIVRWNSDSGLAIVTALDRDGSPSWILKRAHDPQQVACVRREWRALMYLRPWAPKLGIPEVLEWCDQGDEVCLIQTPLVGSRLHPRVSLVSAELASGLGAALDWLGEFQESVPAPAGETIERIAVRWLQQCGREPAAAGIGRELERFVADHLDCARGLPAVAAHGDFWHGNLIASGGCIQVFDWSGFSEATPLCDLITLVLRADVRYRWRAATLAERFHALLIDPDVPVARALAARFHLRPLALTPEQFRFCLYFELAKRLRWELGLAEQPRRAEDIARAESEWRPLIAALARSNFPPPLMGLGRAARQAAAS